MKKILIFTLIMFSLVGCSNATDKTEIDTPNEDEEKEDIVPNVTPTYPVEDFIREPIELNNFTPLVNGLDNYKYVWGDEFEYEGTPNTSKWGYDIGDGSDRGLVGWGNAEKQYYTNKEDNVYVSNGNMVITGKKEKFEGYDYTSSRVITKDTFKMKYGYVEIKSTLADVTGAWPAFWMLPVKNIYGGWPKSGEIDIVESFGQKYNDVSAALHMASAFSTNAISKTSLLATHVDILNNYSTYGLKWTENKIEIYFNNQLYFSYSKPVNATYETWPYDNDFYLLMNLALGGYVGGTIPNNFDSVDMNIDYVRVYQEFDSNDNEKPTIVEGLSCSNDNILTWNQATDNIGVSHYEIVINNKTMYATRDTKFELPDLQLNKTYDIKLCAIDYNNNYSITDSFIIEK